MDSFFAFAFILKLLPTKYGLKGRSKLFIVFLWQLSEQVDLLVLHSPVKDPNGSRTEGGKITVFSVPWEVFVGVPGVGSGNHCCL